MDILDLNNENFISDLEHLCKQNPKIINYLEKENGISLIIMAIYKNKLNFAEWLVDHGAEVNTPVDGTPLSFACLYGNPKLIKKIFIKCNEEFKYKCNPLELAIYSTNITHVDILLKNGYKINERDGYGYSPLYYAISSIETFDFDGEEFTQTQLKRQLKMLEHILSKGAILDEMSEQALNYLLELTSETTKRNVLSILSYFIHFDYVNSKNKIKKTPFLLLMKWLLENGAHTEYTYECSYESLAAGLTYTECFLSDLVKIADTELLKIALKHTQLNLLPEELHFRLIDTSHNVEKVEKLLEAGLNPNAKLSETIDLSILCKCIKNKKFNYANLLISYGAKFTTFNGFYKQDAFCLLISNASSEKDEAAGALITLDLMMNNKLNLLNYDFSEKIVTSQYIKDIFDISVERRVYHWFEPYTKPDCPNQMTTDEIWLYTQKRLINIMNIDVPPNSIIWS